MPGNQENEDKTAEQLSEEISEGISEGYIREMIELGKERRDFARAAANITEDRYCAGSTAAKAVLAIYLKHGYRTALEFIEDLEHHE